MARVLDVFLIIVLIALLGAGIYYYFYVQENPIDNFIREQAADESIEDVSGILESESASYSAEQEASYKTSFQFYPNMRFFDRTISYNVESACSQKKAEQVEKAVEIIKDATILDFYPAGDLINPQIRITCSKLAPTLENRDYFVAGEGGPTEVINATAFALIVNGNVSLFRDEKCETPNVAIHEILHVLGFDHSENPLSIMYNTTDCKQKLDSLIAEEIDRIYSFPSAPDLVVEKVNVTRDGSYIDFDATIANNGLRDAVNQKLTVFANGDKIKDFDIELLEPGTKKILRVKNLKIGGADKVIFIVDAENNTVEISESNNKAELVV